MAEQGSFTEMQDRLFAEQAMWKRSDDPMTDLEAMAGDLGLDVDRWRSCVTCPNGFPSRCTVWACPSVAKARWTPSTWPA